MDARDAVPVVVHGAVVDDEADHVEVGDEAADDGGGDGAAAPDGAAAQEAEGRVGDEHTSTTPGDATPFPPQLDAIVDEGTRAAPRESLRVNRAGEAQ